MKSHRQELWFEIPTRRGFVLITPEVREVVRASGVREGLVLVNAMHITASVFINDDEAGLHADYERWLEELAPHAPTSRYRHNETGEDNGDAHLKRQVMGREVVVAGAVNGDLSGSELLVLEEGARVVGNVTAPTVGIRPGALVRGRVETTAPRANTEASRPVARAAVTPRAATPAKPASKPARKSAAKKSASKAKAKRTAKAAPKPTMPKPGRSATKKASSKRAATKKAAPKPAMPAPRKRTKKASKKTAKKAPSKRRVAKKAPAPVVPALKKRTKKASKRRAR